MEILKFNPCKEAVEFRKQFNSFKESWEACPRGDWMLWIASKLEVDIRLLTKAKVECAKTVKHLMKDERSLKALEVAELFSDGKATIEELNAAYAASDAADYDGYASAYASAYAAAAAAANAAAAAAASSTYISEKEKNQNQTADICRKYLTEAVLSKI